MRSAAGCTGGFRQCSVHIVGNPSMIGHGKFTCESAVASLVDNLEPCDSIDNDFPSQRPFALFEFRMKLVHATIGIDVKPLRCGLHWSMTTNRALRRTLYVPCESLAALGCAWGLHMPVVSIFHFRPSCASRACVLFLIRASIC